MCVCVCVSVCVCVCMCVCVCLCDVVLAITPHCWQLKALHFEGKIITDRISAIFLQLWKSCIILLYKTKCDFAISAHLKLEKCTNLADYFEILRYGFGIASGCKKLILKTLKIPDCRFLSFEKCRKYAYHKFIVGWERFGLKNAENGDTSEKKKRLCIFFFLIRF